MRITLQFSIDAEQTPDFKTIKQSKILNYNIKWNIQIIIIFCKLQFQKANQHAHIWIPPFCNDVVESRC